MASVVCVVSVFLFCVKNEFELLYFAYNGARVFFVEAVAPASSSSSSSLSSFSSTSSSSSFPLSSSASDLAPFSSLGSSLSSLPVVASPPPSVSAAIITPGSVVAPPRTLFSFGGSFVFPLFVYVCCSSLSCVFFRSTIYMLMRSQRNTTAPSIVPVCFFLVICFAVIVLGSVVATFFSFLCLVGFS